jgi:tetratricopeptide (TPR) repeat protein/DNA-binding CsgD family transcriptional regulator
MRTLRYPVYRLPFTFINRSLVIAAACLCFLTSNAQYGKLLNKTYAERASSLWAIGDSVYLQPDSNSAFRVAGNLMEFGKKHQDIALQLEAELYAIYYIKTNYPQQEERILNTLNDIIRQAIHSKSWVAELKAKTVLADFYWKNLQNYELALEEYNKLYHMLDQVKISEYPEKVQVLYAIGSAYFYFKDYSKAIWYFRKVPQSEMVADFQKYCYIQSVNTMGIAYQELGNLDSSDYCFNQLCQYCARIKDSTWINIVKGNRGQNEYLRGHYEKAIPLMKACIERAIIDSDWGLASGSLMPLAEIYFKQNKIAEAIATTLQAKDFVERSGRYRRYRYLYPLLAKMYAYKGNTELSGMYMDSALLVTDSLNRKFSGIMMARALQKDAITEQRAKLADVQNRKQLLTFKFYIFLALAVIAFFVTIYIYRSKRLQHQQEQLLKDLQLKEKEKELLSAQAQLMDFTRHLAEKNQLIHQFEKRNGNNKVLEELEHSIILTGKDWGHFRNLFEQVYPCWLQRLTEKIRGISPSEMRMMALAKLNFSNKEMAAALGVSTQAIRVTWHRLRKKMDLPEDDTIEELVNTI